MFSHSRLKYIQIVYIQFTVFSWTFF